MQILKSKSGYVNLVHVGGGVSQEALLNELGQIAIEQGLAREGVVQALLDRERDYPTGIQAQLGVAIPHADKAFTNREAILIAVLDKPVPFSPMGGGDSPVDVEVVFLLLLDDADRHLSILSTIADLIQDEQKLCACKEGEDPLPVLMEAFESETVSA